MSKNSDDWLDRWLATISRASSGATILELGCGEGRDTQRLHDAGIKVVGIDRSRDAIHAAVRRNLGCSFVVGDIRSDLPNDGAEYPVVLASLCLHYFSWKETIEAVERIHVSLADGGLLLARVNSTRDVNYGAVGHPEIETNYYDVRGRAKRFFDERALKAVFAANKWNVVLREENEIHRYEKPKFVWEVALTKVAPN